MNLCIIDYECISRAASLEVFAIPCNALKIRAEICRITNIMVFYTSLHGAKRPIRKSASETCE